MTEASTTAVPEAATRGVPRADRPEAPVRLRSSAGRADLQRPARPGLRLPGPDGAGKTTTMRAIFGVRPWRPARCAGAASRYPSRPGTGSATCPRSAASTRACSLEQLEYLGRLHDMTAPAARTAARNWIGRLGLAGRAIGQARGAVTRQPAAGAAGRRADARPGAARARRAVRRPGSGRRRRHDRDPGRAGRAPGSPWCSPAISSTWWRISASRWRSFTAAGPWPRAR